MSSWRYPETIESLVPRACVAPYNAAYFLKVDPWRGPALFAGITVEKGVEDQQEAARRAQAKGIAAKELLLGKGWDWDRADEMVTPR